MHTCAHSERWILFTWDLRRGIKRRRWFYTKLQRLLNDLPVESWRKIGGSVYIVEEKHSAEFVEFLRSFEGPGLGWFKFRIES